MRFYLSFIQLTFFLVKLDIQTLQEARTTASTPDRRIPALYSGGYLHQLTLLTRRDLDVEDENTSSNSGAPPHDDSTILLDELEACSSDSLGLLDSFVTALVDILPALPKLIDYLGSVTQLVVVIVQRAVVPSQQSDDVDKSSAAEDRVDKSHQLWAKASECLTVLLNKHVTQLTNDGVPLAITALSQILRCSSSGSHPLAVQLREEYCRTRDLTSQAWVPDGIALEWRFEMLGRLIRCSQMQLRVTGVTTMCSELVNLWKRLGEDSDNPLLRQVGKYLLSSELIEYILGPNCHPEIIVESANIVGFLVVTKMYRQEHTDRLWQVMTSSQDPRVADALARMVGSITNLFDYSSLSELCAKFDELPIACFTTSMRSLWDQIARQMVNKCSLGGKPLSFQPYKLCLRLLRESSVCNSKYQIAHPDAQYFAMQKFRELLNHGPDPAGRDELYRSCLEDLSQKSETTLGSLWALTMAIRPTIAHEMQILAQNHDLTKLVVEEFEHVVKTATQTGIQSVICGTANQPRRDLVTNIIRYQPGTIDDGLGSKLWGLLVGPLALCRQDREAGWKILNDTMNRNQGKNVYIRTCLAQYLPALPASCLCEGTLDFVKYESLSLVGQHDDFHLDDLSAVRSSSIEQLWRIILTCEDPSLALHAIHSLAVEVYMNNELLAAYPALRMRQVHLYVVRRCFDQMRGSAARIGESRNSLSSREEADSASTVTADNQADAEPRIFIRSLQLLRYFLEAHQSKPHLAAPDLRALMSQSPSEIAGDPAQLKYQSFDGMQQTEVRPLMIGVRNTAASLLASLRRETGFQNYRAYYRGRPFVPNEHDVCRSLEELQIQEGLILVKREVEDAENGGNDAKEGAEEENPASFKYRPGTSSLQIEVLSHFAEMWDYLILEESLAREVGLNLCSNRIWRLIRSDLSIPHSPTNGYSHY